MLGRLDEGVCFMTTTTRRVYCGVLVMVFVLVFSIGLFAQSRPAAVSTSPSPVARDLNTTLAELMRASPATSQDLMNLQQQGGRLHRVTFWRGDKAQKAKMTAALRRNLQFAVPDLIHECASLWCKHLHDQTSKVAENPLLFHRVRVTGLMMQSAPS